MAVTKIWPVKDSLERVVGYAKNPEKTEYADLSKKLNSLSGVIRYASNAEKTEGEKACLVTTINCHWSNDPATDMQRIKEHYGKTGGNVAYHGYQSFKPGEVTPEQCHELGIRLAKAMWGDRFQVLVATHLDRGHLHNHFVINSVSFADGKKYNCSKKEYGRMRRISDALCNEYRLSVVKNPSGHTPRAIHFAEVSGKDTKYRLMGKAVADASGRSISWNDFCHHLHDAGYDFNPDFGHKYAKIKRIEDEKWTRLYHTGWNLDKIESRLILNLEDEMPAYEEYYEIKKEENGVYPEGKNRDMDFYTMLFVQLRFLPTPFLILALIILLSGGPDRFGFGRDFPQNEVHHEPLTPKMQETRKYLDIVKRQTDLMEKRHLKTHEDIDRYLDGSESELQYFAERRQQARNKLRRCTDETTKEKLKSEIKEYTKHLQKIRRETRDLRALLLNEGEMLEMIKSEEEARRKDIMRKYYVKDATQKIWDTGKDDYIPKSFPKIDPYGANGYGPGESLEDNEEICDQSLHF